MLHATSCLGGLLGPGCCRCSDFCGCLPSLIHFGQTSWNTTPSANSHPGARSLCDVTKIPLQDFQEAWHFLWVCACPSFGRKEKIQYISQKHLLRPASSGQALLSYEQPHAGERQVLASTVGQGHGVSTLSFSCFSPARVLPAHTPSIDCNFPPTLAHKISFCIFSCTCFSHPPYSVLCFKSASSTVIS